eukprot:scaffold249358_cov74-Cyclotella_meneghiniana.AAC.2
MRHWLFATLCLGGSVYSFILPTKRVHHSIIFFSEIDEKDDVVRSPLRFLGPYPTIPLRFPHLATASQRSRNVTGISLDFVIDTAANTNTINQQVATELELEQIGEAPGGVGAAGGIQGGAMYMLGDCELDLGIYKPTTQDKSSDDKEETKADPSFVFMQGLTASALPIASPAAAGLLSLAFLYCFEGGVEFRWSSSTSAADQPPPSVTFYGSNKYLDVTGLRCIPFERLPVSMLPAVTLSINGVEIPALFDTGSPITVLNAKAAETAGIMMAVTLNPSQESKPPSWNPLSKIVDNIKSASAIAEATSRGDILAIAGADGKPIQLVKSQAPVNIMIQSSKNPTSSSFTEEQNKFVDLAESSLFVGDLPGLAALHALGGESSPPGAVLGMDVITRCHRVVFRAQQKEIYL